MFVVDNGIANRPTVFVGNFSKLHWNEQNYDTKLIIIL